MESGLSPDTLRSVTKPETSYIICASQRSGSSLLGEALRLTGVAGRPEEYFLVWQMAAREPERLAHDFGKPSLIPPAAYLEKVLGKGTTPNGVFGVKIMWDQFDIVIDNITTITRYCDLRPREALKAVFPNLRYIYITRRDKARQAVSLAKAIQSDRWVEFDPSVLERPEYQDTEVATLLAGGAHPFSAEELALARAQYAERIKDQLRPNGRILSYDFEQIAHFETHIRKCEEGWEAYFTESAIEPFRVVYEEFADAYEQTALDVLRFLGVPRVEEVVFWPRLRRKQSDAVNEEWAQRYKAERASRTS